jgi:hypothetical protein
MPRSDVMPRRIRGGITIATPGFPKVNAGTTESQNLGIRGENATWKWEGESMGNEVNGGPLTVFSRFMIEGLRSWQTDLPTLNNFLCRWPNVGQVQIWYKNGAGEFVSHTANTGTPAVPVGGPGLVNLGAKYHNSKAERYLDLMVSAQYTNEEFAIIDTNKAAFQAGGSGGTEAEINAMTVDRAKVLKPGFMSMTVNATTYWDKIVDIVHEIETVGQDDLNRGEIVYDGTKHTITATFANSKIADGKEAFVAALNRYGCVLTDMNGATWTYGAGAVNWRHVYTYGDGASRVMFEGTGIQPMNIDEAAPDALDIGIAGATAVVVTAQGY